MKKLFTVAALSLAIAAALVAQDHKTPTPPHPPVFVQDIKLPPDELAPERVHTTAAERRVRAEVLLRRIALFTRGVMIGSREFVDGWFEANRSTVKGRSQLERKRGSRSLGRPALRGLYSLRDPRN